MKNVTQETNSISYLNRDIHSRGRCDFMKFDKIFRNRRAINCPTTNGQVRSSAIHRTFRHYTELKNQYLPGKCVLSAVLFLLIAGALLMTPQAAFAQAPTVSSIAITSDPGADKTYIFGEKVQVTVTFSESL